MKGSLSLNASSSLKSQVEVCLLKGPRGHLTALSFVGTVRGGQALQAWCDVITFSLLKGGTHSARKPRLQGWLWFQQACYSVRIDMGLQAHRSGSLVLGF